MELVSRLQRFCRVERKQADVYFDGAPPGRAETRKMGLVTAHFVRIGWTADAAIRARLKALGREARTWIVVTSDRQVQADARAAGSQVSSSETFAKRVLESEGAPDAAAPSSDAKISEEEVEEWLRLFRENKR